MPTFDRIYDALPIALQNFAISGKGWQLQRNRFGGQFRKRLERAVDRASWGSDKLAQFQLEELNRLIQHSKESSAHYRHVLRSIEGDLSSVNDLEQLPILEKETLRSCTEKIRSTTYPKPSLIKVNTSGTTGAPINLGFTKADIQERHALLYRFYSWYGIKPGMRNARFSGKPIFAKTEGESVFWRRNRSGNQLLLSSYHLHPKNAQHYIDALAEFKPIFMDGYPSMMCFIARHLINSEQIGKIRPSLIMTTAEELDQAKRSLLEDAFQCPVANFYASSEGAPYITETPQGNLVVNSDSGVFEFVKPGTSERAKPGELAELIVTSFSSYAYPLIRYRIGDTVQTFKGETSSEILKGMPLVASIGGRTDDTLWTPYRGDVVALNRVFVDLPSTIIESQIVQPNAESVCFRYVPDRSSGFTKEQLEPLKRELHERLGPIEVTMEEVDQLMRGPSGKLRAVVREFDPDSRPYPKQ